jgi:XTP/dITP diphosphohydrolase
MIRLVLATTNKKKLIELQGLLNLPGLELKTLADYPSYGDVDETGATFAENAEIKAVAAAVATGQWALGEDSGLIVDALDGRPGIYSARYGGEPRSDERNNDKLLAELAGVPNERRTARYCCSAAIAEPTGRVRFRGEGYCEGRILHARVGAGGFGYDPLFFVPDAGKSFGELPPEYKQRHSHRAAAMRGLVPELARLAAGRST